MPVQGSTRQRKSGSCSCLEQGRRAVLMPVETPTQDSDSLETSRASAATRRKSRKPTPSRGTTRTLPASGLPITITVVFTITLLTRIARKLAELGRQVGWKTDSRKTITATIMLGTPTPTEAFKFETKTSMQVLSIACRAARTQ